MITTGNRYKLDTGKLANKLVAIFLRARRHVLWIQALLKPLHILNDAFQDYVNDIELEAQMTSRVIQFKAYLNNKLNTYFIDPTDEIYFDVFQNIEAILFNDGDFGEIPFVVYGIEESWTSEDLINHPKPLYGLTEEVETATGHFKVIIPPLNVTEDGFTEIITAIIERYRLAGKTYTLKFL